MTPTTPQISREKTGSAAPAVPRGHFVWHELLANDESVAKLFYTKVMGWTTETWKTPPGAPPYTMWSTAGKSFAGLMTLPEEARAEGAPSHWLGYVSVPDVDASLAQAKRLGAQVHMGPMDIPEVGRMAVIADPQGAAIALFTPKPRPDAGPAPGMGIVSWHELATTDWKKAWEFYHELFGWQKGEAMDMGAMGTYQIFTLGSAPGIGAIFNRPPQIPVSNWLYYFKVSDLDAAVEKTKANGGKVVNGPMDVPGGRIAQCMDPQGAMFALHWMKEG